MAKGSNNDSGSGGIILLILGISVVATAVSDLFTNHPFATVAIAVCIVALIVYFAYEGHKHQKERQELENSRIYSLQELDAMNGYQFENAVAWILKRNGYVNVDVTPSSGDFGADIIATRDGTRYAIQCKCYSGSVGNHAVQEVYAAMAHYGCSVGMVITNSHFTKSATKQAESTGVILIDRDGLNRMCIGKTMESMSTAEIQEMYSNDLFIEQFGMEWLVKHSMDCVKYFFADYEVTATLIDHDEYDDYITSSYKLKGNKENIPSAINEVSDELIKYFERKITYQLDGNNITFVIPRELGL